VSGVQAGTPARRVDPALLVVIISTVCAEPGVWPVCCRGAGAEELAWYRREVRRLQGNRAVPGGGKASKAHA